MRADARKNAAIIRANAEAYANITKSKAMADVASLKAEATTKVAEAEAKQSKALEQKRKFELLKKRTEILDTLANNKKVLITSNTKDDRFQIWSGLEGSASQYRIMGAGPGPNKGRTV